MDRLFPYGQPAPNPRSPAPVMEYALFNRPAGAPELLGHRAKALRHHPLSMEVDRNRALAWRAILGDDEHEGVQRDILTVTIGIDPAERLRHVAQTMGAGWMESVLSWPHRFVLPFDAGSSEPAELAFTEQSSPRTDRRSSARLRAGAPSVVVGNRAHPSLGSLT